MSRGLDLSTWGPDRVVNLAHFRLVGEAGQDQRDRIGELLAESIEAWEPYLNPAGTDTRPAGAPSWWRGDEDAAQVTQAGVSTLQRRTAGGG